MHGSCPGECGMRFFTSQALVADPRSTNRFPAASIANGCMGWSPVSGRPETIVSGFSPGTIAPWDDAIVDRGVKRAIVERDSGSAVSAFGKGFAEAAHHIGVSGTRRVLQRHQEAVCRRRIIPVIHFA